MGNVLTLPFPQIRHTGVWLSLARRVEVGPMNAQWLRIRENLQKTLQSGLYKVWIAPLHGSVQGNCLRLAAPNAFVAGWVRDRLLHAVREAAVAELGPEALVEMTVEEAAPEQSGTHAETGPSLATILDAAGTSPLPLPASAASRHGGARPGLSTDTSMGTPVFSSSEQLGLPYELPTRSIAWRYTFDGFVVGPCNELAHAAARSMTRDTAAVDTLFLSSAPGLGKTHLSQSVGQAVSAASNRSRLRVEYLTAEEFSSCFVQAMKARDIERFKARFREVDMLLLEDVEFLQKKEKMQDEVLATIKTLQSRGSRVVLTSSFAPKELQDLDGQLVSRFCSGFLADIGKPDLAMRRRILEEKAQTRDMTLPESVSELLASKLPADVRQMESCLYNLILKAQLLGCTISIDLAREVLSQYVENVTLFGMDGIISKVCEGFGLNAAQLQSRSRRQNYVVARNTIYFLARKHTDMTLEEIGDYFGRRHSTVIKGIAAIERELKRETPLGRQVAAALSRIEA